MKVYIDRDVSEEFAISLLYDDCIDCEVELSDEEYDELTRVNREYWAWQEKLMDLYEKAMAKQGSNA